MFFLPSFKTCEIIKAVPVILARGRWRQGVTINSGQSYIVTYTAAEARIWDAVLTWETERCHQLFQRWSSEVKLTCLCKLHHLKVRIQASWFSFPIFLIPSHIQKRLRWSPEQRDAMIMWVQALTASRKKKKKPHHFMNHCKMLLCISPGLQSEVPPITI